MPFLAPIFGAIAGAAAGVSAWIGGLGVIGSALVKIGGSLLLSAASQALMPKPKRTLQDRKVTVRAPTAPRDLVYGRVRKGGVIVFIHATGSSNNDLHLVVVLTGHQVEKLGDIYLDGELAVADGATTGTGRYSGFVTVDRRLGADSQTAFAGLVSVAPDKWTAEHRLAGCAAVYLKLKASQNVFPSGIPNVSIDIKGKNDILDPRTGLRGYSENVALCVADYMSLVNFSLGAQIGAADGTDIDTLIEAANICDEAVDVPGGGTEPRYTCNGSMSLSETPQTIIEAMLDAMAGSVAWLGGAWRIRAGAYRIPTVELFDNDVREGGLSLETRVSRTDSFNAVRGTFISPENDWQPDDFPAYESAGYLAEDGGERRWRDIALPFTISASAAQRLARITLETNRRQMTVNMNGKLSAWRVSVGGTAMLTYARWGMAAKPFEVQGLTLNLTGDESPELVPNLVLRETSPLVYDWDATEAAIYAAAPRTTLPSAFDIPAPGTPQITEALYVTRDGAGVKALATLTWSASESGFVSEYRIEAQLEGGDWVEQGRANSLLFEILDIEPGIWGFRVKAVSMLGVSSPWAETTKEIFGLGAVPAAITGSSLQSAGGLAVIKWDQHPELDVRIGGSIVIRHTASDPATWAGSVGMDRVNGSQANTAVPLKPGTYLLRAEDSGGRLSDPIAVSTTGAQALAFSSVGFLQAETAFAGAGDGLAVVDGRLRLDAAVAVDSWADVDAIVSIDSEGGVTPNGLYEFVSGLDFGTVKPVRLRSDIELIVIDLSDKIDDRARLIDDWADFEGVDGSEVDVVMEYRATNDNPASSPVWGGWSRVDSAEVLARAVQGRATLSTTDQSFTPAVSRLRLYADEVA